MRSCAHRGQVATIYFQLVSSSCPACVCVYSLHSSYGRSISVLLLEKKASPVRRADAPATPPRDHSVRSVLVRSYVTCIAYTVEIHFCFAFGKKGFSGSTGGRTRPPAPRAGRRARPPWPACGENGDTEDRTQSPTRTRRGAESQSQRAERSGQSGRRRHESTQSETKHDSRHAHTPAQFRGATCVVGKLIAHCTSHVPVLKRPCTGAATGPGSATRAQAKDGRVRHCRSHSTPGDHVLKVGLASLTDIQGMGMRVVDMRRVYASR